MLDGKQILCAAFLTVCLVIGLFDADAFNPQSSPPARNASYQYSEREQGKVAIFDNDYLDRLFGGTRRRESKSQSSQDPATNERQALSANENATLNIPIKPSAQVLPNRSLLTGTQRGTPGRRAAALRLAETGRTLLQMGQRRKAIYHLEKALSIDASPFIHFYLARAHYELAEYESAQRFLDVAENGLNGQPEWMPELGALRAALSSTAEQSFQKPNVAWTFNE
jgi:tetratricopeptide (TPR) repeat protein